MKPLASAALAEYAANPEGTKAVWAAYRAALEDGDRLRAHYAKQRALADQARLEENELLRAELARRAVIPSSVQPPPGPVPGGIRHVLAVNLRVRMAQRDINQRELSDLAGISQRHISQIMNCVTGVSVDVVETLARALNTTPADLLTHRPGL